MIYEFGADGMKRIDTSANNAKNNLPIGTVLQLNGYSDPRYVIVKKLSLDQKYGYGALYQTVSLEDGRFYRKEAYAMKHISEKQHNGIQMYYTDEVVSPDEVLALYEKASTLETLAEQQKEEAQQRRDSLIAKGREIAIAKGIESATALIVAEYEQDESDSMTDYFGTKTTQRVILATSKHKRDIFSEMRKAAAKFEKTAHLATAPNVDRNGEQKTDKNADWWHPSDEHREKYSMGAGYYLKSSGHYSSGWLVCKVVRYGEKWGDDIYISLAQICLI